MAITIKEVREKYPEYSFLSDKELADKLHTKHYSQMDKEEFYSRVGLKPESLKDKVTRYGLKGPLASAAQFGHQLLNIPHNVANFVGAGESVPAFRPGYDYRQALGLPKEQNLADMAIMLAPEIAGGMAIPGANLGRAGQAISNIPKAGKYISRILSEALPQAGFAGLMAKPEHMGESAAIAGALQTPFSAAAQLAESPLPAKQKAAAYLLGGLGGAATGYGLEQMGFNPTVSTAGGIAAGLLGKKAAGTKGMMMEELASGKNAPLAEKRLAAAERLGLDYLTPAEAFNSPYLARKQGALGRTPEGSELFYEKAQQRIGSEEKAINKLLHEIHDPKTMGPKAEKLYEESYKKILPPEFGERYKNNWIVNEALNKVEGSHIFREAIKKLPREEGVNIDQTIGYWDFVKRALDDMVESAPKSEARIISEARNDLKRSLDNYSPEYKEARALEERKFAREGLEKAFDKTDIHSDEAFYKAIKSDAEFKKLLHHVRNVPGAEQKLKDMRELFKDLSKPPSIKTAKGLESTGMYQFRNAGDFFKNLFENMGSGGKFDKEAIEFITSKDWSKQLEEINKITDKQKRMAKIIEVFGKGVAQSQAAKKQPYLTTENYQVYED